MASASVKTVSMPTSLQTLKIWMVLSIWGLEIFNNMISLVIYKTHQVDSFADIEAKPRSRVVEVG